MVGWVGNLVLIAALAAAFALAFSRRSRGTLGVSPPIALLGTGGLLAFALLSAASNGAAASTAIALAQLAAALAVAASVALSIAPNTAASSASASAAGAPLGGGGGEGHAAGRPASDQLPTAASALTSQVDLQEDRAAELSLIKARFETALRGAKIYVFSQDLDLRYTWVYSPHGEDSASELIGKTDADIATGPDQEQITAVKRQVIETGVPADAEVSYLMPEGRTLFALRVDPSYGPDGKIAGIMCAAIDVTRIRSLESEQRRLSEELSSALQRYETALRGSHITVFTQDRDLRYTSISRPMFGREVQDIIGKTDLDILIDDNQADWIALKHAALESGNAVQGEVRFHNGQISAWYDFHCEPLRDVAGQIVGLSCAAVDITERKENESHLRFLMRELTHRSKNLLAVTQAMARQTARGAPSLDAFIEQFGSRLQALARSHDLLVQESWHGASLDELVESQLDLHFDRSKASIQVGGPRLMLKPEAAQTLGLALHELATNSVVYGTRSEAPGSISVRWSPARANDRTGIQMEWSESGPSRTLDREQRGFGAVAFERSLVRSLEAEVDLSIADGGVHCRIFIPASQFSSPIEVPPAEPRSPANV